MQERQDRVKPDPFGGLREVPPISVGSVHTLSDLSNQTRTARKIYHLLAQQYNVGNIDRWGEGERRVVRELPVETDGVSKVRRKVTILDDDGGIKVIRSRKGELVHAVPKGQGPSSEPADIPEMTLFFPAAPYLLPSKIHGVGHEMLLEARVRDEITGEEIVFSPSDFPYDEYHQQGFADAFNAVTKAFIS